MKTKRNKFNQIKKQKKTIHGIIYKKQIVVFI
jgi:hypothetical protein